MVTRDFHIRWWRGKTKSPFCSRCKQDFVFCYTSIVNFWGTFLLTIRRPFLYPHFWEFVDRARSTENRWIPNNWHWKLNFCGTTVGYLGNYFLVFGYALGRSARYSKVCQTIMTEVESEKLYMTWNICHSKWVRKVYGVKFQFDFSRLQIYSFNRLQT